MRPRHAESPQTPSRQWKLFFFSSRRRHTRCRRDWSSDVCSSDLEVTSISKEAGDDIERPNNPTKEGYTFVNWYLDMELENVFVFDKMPTEDTVLYAKWDEIGRASCRERL